MDTPTEKRCPKCGEIKLLSEFSIAKLGKCGRKSHCKACVKIEAVIYREAHREELNAKHSAYVKTPRGKESHERWRREHPDKVKQYENKRTNIEERRAITARWEKSHSERVRANKHRQRARKRGLPNTFTDKDWQIVSQYFKGRCAVCERLPDFWHTLAMDHWIPLVSQECPGTVPENMIPLCHSKKDAPVGWPGCNNSKNDSDPHEWLVGKFGKRKAKEIEQRVQGYVEWLKGKH